MHVAGRCPACGDAALFVALDFKPPARNRPEQPSLFMHPSSSQRTPLTGFAEIDGIPAALTRAYTSALTVFNAGEWNGTAPLVRRALEGVTKTQLTRDPMPRTLAEQLQALAEDLELDEPLLSLAHALRKGGNLGAHFDLEREVDRETASLMLDLLDYLLEYLYVLPERVRSLDERVSGLST